MIGDEVVVAAGGDRLLALSRTGAGAQWKFSDLTRLADVHVPSRVRSAGFAAEGSSILAVGDDGGVFVFDAASGTQRHALRGDEIHVIGSAFSGDGRWSAVSAADGTIRVWNWRRKRSRSPHPAAPAALRLGLRSRRHPPRGRGTGSACRRMGAAGGPAARRASGGESPG